jgi:hypothetical protein
LIRSPGTLDRRRVDPLLTEQIPRVGRLENVETFSQQNYVLFAGFLERRRSEIRVIDGKLASFVCVTTIEALTHTAVLHRKILSDGESEALIDEATRLIVGYLTG